MAIFSYDLGDYLEIIPWCRCGNQGGISLLTYFVAQMSGGPLPSDELAAALGAALAPKYIALLSSDASYDGVTIQRISATPSNRDGSVTGAGAGIAAGGVLPTQTCGLISKRAALSGRTQRGRVYVPFPGEDDSVSAGPSGSQPSVGYLINLFTLGSYILQNITPTLPTGTTTLQPVIRHVANLTLSPSITGRIERQKWATHRSRGAFGRPGPFYPL